MTTVVTPPDERVAEAHVGRVDRVERPQPGAVRVGHLVDVLAGPALALLVDAEVAVRVDKARAAPTAARVDRRDARGHRDLAPDRHDLAVLIRTVPPSIVSPSTGTTNPLVMAMFMGCNLSIPCRTGTRGAIAQIWVSCIKGSSDS